jgi:peroxiredoxin
MSGNAWVCTIITLILILSGAEQAVRIVSGKTGPKEPPPQIPTGPKLGDQPPTFTLPNEKGKKVSLAEFQGKPVVVNFFCGCQKCIGVGKMLGEWQKKENVQMVGLVTFKPEFYSEFRRDTGIQFPLLLDPEKEIGMQWNSMICPRIWVLDGKGRAVYTNPQQPEMMGPQQTIAMAVKAWKNPVVPAAAKQAAAKVPSPG